jgi:hypothetical protein
MSTTAWVLIGVIGALRLLVMLLPDDTAGGSDS